MIQPNEIRIGNLVLCEGKEAQVECVRRGEIIVGQTGKTVYFLARMTDIKPIPLTEEVLLRCGFESSSIDELDPNGIFLFMDLGLITLDQSECKTYLTDQATGTLRIEFLHQLQNLFFALTGEELEYRADK